MELPNPPKTEANIAVTISREGKVIGSWPLPAILPMLISGELRPSDHFWRDADEGWLGLITEPPIRCTPYPFAGRDLPYYFIHDGLLYGPRTSGEIDVLYAAQWLKDDDWITFYSARQWWTVRDMFSEK